MGKDKKSKWKERFKQERNKRMGKKKDTADVKAWFDGIGTSPTEFKGATDVDIDEGMACWCDTATGQVYEVTGIPVCAVRQPEKDDDEEDEEDDD